MPRLSPAHADQRRAHIEKAALRCFLKLGYHGSSVRDIAAAAKLSLGAVYTYFPDKLSLFAALLERLSAEFLLGDSRLRHYLTACRFPDDLPELAEALAADTVTFRDYFKMIYLDVVEFDGEHIQQVFSHLEPKFRMVLGERFRSVGKLGKRRRSDPGFAFVAIYLLFYQYFVLTKLFGAKQIFGARTDTQVVAEFVELFLGGLTRWRLLHFTMIVTPIALTLEALVAHFQRPKALAWRDTFTNIFIYLIYSGILTFWTASTYFIYDRVGGHALFDLSSEGPLARAWAPAPWVLLVVLEDLCFYTFHRSSHRVRLLWTAHQVHHSSTRFNLSTALRQSWLPFVAVPFWLPLPFLGFAPEDVLTVQLASLFFQFFLHTELVRSYGLLDAVFNSPRHHRAHHGLEEQFVDRNFGGVLILWDHLFGSFTHGQPAAYGVGDPASMNPLAIQGGPWLRLARDIRRAPTWASKLWTVIGPPEFNPLPEASTWPAGSPSRSQ